MSRTWHSPDRPDLAPLTPAALVRIAVRGLALVVVIGGGLLGLVVLRLFERPLCAPRRPVTPAITRAVCRIALALIGLRPDIAGLPRHGVAAVLVNHVSWLDIFALNAGQRLVFVAKSEVAGWPGIGWLARATGTVFVRRDRGEVTAQIATLRDRLAAGETLVLFPEGTSTDGQQVLGFRPALLAALFDPGSGRPGSGPGLGPVSGMQVQPVTLQYDPPDGVDPRFYGWWGDMEFGAHLLRVLAAPRPGRVRLIYHPVLNIADFADRKALSHAAETTVRAGLKAGLSASRQQASTRS